MAFEHQNRTKESILEEKHQEEINKAFDPSNKLGVKSHLFFGHGPTDATFEKRDLCTTNQMVYEQRQKVDQIIDPHLHVIDKTGRHKFNCNSKSEDLPNVFVTT